MMKAWQAWGGLLLVLLSGANASTNWTFPGDWVPLPPHDARHILCGEMGSTVKIDCWIDPLCIDSALALYGLYDVCEHYSNEQVQVIVHQYPLAYHRNSFPTSMVQEAVAAIEPRRYFDVLNATFGALDALSWPEGVNMTEDGVFRFVADIAETQGVNKTELLQEVNDQYVYYNLVVRTSYKYGMQQRVLATPTFAVNGLMGTWGDREGPRLYDFRAVLDPLLEMPPQNSNQTYVATAYLRTSASILSQAKMLDEVESKIVKAAAKRGGEAGGSEQQQQQPAEKEQSDDQGKEEEAKEGKSSSKDEVSKSAKLEAAEQAAARRFELRRSRNMNT